METRLKFDLPKDKSSIIKVLGVGGGGGNAVNHMYSQGIKGVDFVICNTDLQVLEASAIPNKIQLGTGLTAGLGAGSNPEVGKKAAMEAIEDVIEVLGVNTKMLFITAGMGGGTGTGAAPIIAKTAKELDILTVGIVTTPFSFEGKKRKNHADEGIEQLKKSVDCLLIISNDKIKEMYGNLPLRQAFSHANDILTTAAKGIAELITDTGYINVDFEDVKTVMRNSGVALMGSASADGENRAIDAVKAALASPLLNDNQIVGAKNILLNISSGTQEVLMDEVELISSYIQDEAGLTADVIFGTSFDETLGDKIAVTLIATGFETRENIIVQSHTEPRTKHVLYEQPRKPDMVISHLLDEPKPEVTPIPAPEPVAEITPEPIEEIAPEPIIPQEEEIHFELKIEEEETFDIEPQITFETEDDEIKSRVQDAIARDEEIASITSEIHFELPVEEEIDEMPTMNMEEQELRIEQHIQRIKELKNLNVTINSPGGIRDLEKEPAYKRRNKKLNDVPHSSESQVSRLTLFEDTTNKAGIRTNNSFLHDNVD
ncbi:cell division protein FtsZ [Bacteroidetes bacterium UKL13-3]|nr:cell division protein FtsZ [Bacteroidetes bacterium UKL13-3]HCP92907.1 cell division protein FtsZ [Bacteroidota bacterium]